MNQFSNQAAPATDAYSATTQTSASRAGISANQKKMGAIAAATLLLGGAAAMVVGKTKDRLISGTPGGEPLTEGDTPSPVPMPKDVDVAGKVTDGMSFEQAFGAARDEVGVGGVFSWHGHWYNTFEKDEWTGLSLEQRQEYTEMITGEKLPVKPYHNMAAVSGATTQVVATEPTIIEGYLNGQRVMGLDTDRDGVIDTMVLDGPDGTTYRVVDATGDEGLDTIYRYNSLTNEMTAAVRLDHPVMISNDDFSQNLESTMSREVVDSILAPDETAPAASSIEDDAVVEPADDEVMYLADSSEPDDTYVNNGNVRDMDE